MIEFEAVLRLVQLQASELEHWIAERWVLPERGAGTYLFHEVDVARVHLIVELRRDLQIDEEAMPVVLNLLDQMYALRRRLKALSAAVDALPEEMQAAVRRHLAAEPTEKC
jgi:chaperone modulatory protein CbpM